MPSLNMYSNPAISSTNVTSTLNNTLQDLLDKHTQILNHHYLDMHALLPSFTLENCVTKCKRSKLGHCWLLLWL